MRKSAEVILDKYQMRKSKKQKRAFADWLRGHLSEFDYSLTEDKYSKSGINLIVGDIETAEVILTAHYDTQPNFFFPMVMGFSNWFFFIISQFASLLPLLAVITVYMIAVFPIFAASIIFQTIPLAMLFLYCVQIICGIANKHTANDNTSGVVTLISILEEMTAEDRAKVCAVFFDQEELGLIGSGNFAKKHKKAMSDKPLFNFDCVSDGGTLTFVMRKKFKESKCAKLLTDVSAKVMTAGDTDKKVRFADALTNIYMSDQLYFPHGVGIVAAKKVPVLGYYIDRIHSRLDTKFDNENIELLTAMMIELFREI